MIEVSGVAKRYRLGSIGATSLRDEVRRWWDRRGAQAPAPETANADFWALRDVSFDVQPGEVVGIIGRNGAGKSTLLKILSRITEPTTGEIRLWGRVGSLLEVGTGFHPELSGRDNIFLNGAILGMTRAEVARKFDEIVAFAEVEAFLDTPVKRYSSGMYVRLAFAVAAHLEPEILIVDEVLAVGDQQFQKKCIGRMEEISRGDGRTILFVSHSMTTIRRLCPQCIVLRQGHSLGKVPVEQAIELYQQSEQPSGRLIDLSDRARDWGSEGRDCRLLQLMESSPAGLRFGSPMQLCLRVRVRTRLENIMFGVAFTTVDGQRVLTLDTDSNGQTLTLEPGEHRVRLGLDRLPLHPGTYAVNVAVGAGKFFFDIIDGAAQWEVESSSNDWESDRSFGGCRLPPQVEVEPWRD